MTSPAGPGPSEEPLPTEASTPSEELQRTLYLRLIAGAVALLGLGTVVFRWLEDWSWVDAFYFSTVAVTTVGFGDLSPSTDGAKLFTVLYILLGISIIATALDARMKRHAQRRIDHKQR